MRNVRISLYVLLFAIVLTSAMFLLAGVLASTVDDGETYCTEYAHQTGVPTRWAADTCWAGTDGLTGPFYPLDPEAGVGR